MAGADELPTPPDIQAGANAYADDFEMVSKRIANTQIASGAEQVPGWEGQAAQKYCSEAQSLSTHVSTLAKSFSKPVNSLRDWAHTVGEAIREVERWQQEWDDAEAEATQRINALNADRDARQNTNNPMDRLEYSRSHGEIIESKDIQQTRLRESYKNEMERLDSEASATASALTGSINSIVSAADRKGGRDSIGKSLFDDMPLVDGQAEWEYCQGIADDAADLLDMSSPDLIENIKEFNKKYADDLDNPFFANALAERVPPEDMARFVARMGDFKGQIVDPGTHEIDTDFDKAIENVTRSLGTAMVLSTGGMNGDPAYQSAQNSFNVVQDGLMASDGQHYSAVQEHNLDGLKKYGHTLVDSSGEPVDPNFAGMAGTHYGYEYVGHMLGVASENENISLGGGFVEDYNGKDSIARDIITWDNEHPELRQNAFPYSSWNGSHMPGGSYGAYGWTLDPVTSMMKLMDMPDSFADGTPDSLSAAETERADGVRNLLASNTDFAVDGRAMSMTEYLTGHRAVPDIFSGWTDQGDAFGEVIAQNAMPVDKPDVSPDDPTYAEWADRERKSAQITMDFVQGYQDGLQDFGESQGENRFGMMNSQLRSWAGVALAPRVDNLLFEIGSGSGAENTVAEMGLNDDRASFAFSKDLRKSLLGEKSLLTDLAFDHPVKMDDGSYIGGRGPAIDNLRLSAIEKFQEDVDGSSPTTAGVQNIAQKWAPGFNQLFGAHGAADGAHAEWLDETNKRWRELAEGGLGAAGLPGKIPGAGKVTQFIAGQALGAGTDMALDQFLPTNHAELAQASRINDQEVARTLMAQSLYSRYADSEVMGAPVMGKQPDGSFLSTRSGAGLDDYYNSDGTLKDYEDLSPEQRTAFQNFINNNENTANIEHEVNSVFNDTQQNEKNAQGGN